MVLLRLKVLTLFSYLTFINAYSQAFESSYYGIDLRDHIVFKTFEDLPIKDVQYSIEQKPCLFIAPLDMQGTPDYSTCDASFRYKFNPKITLTQNGAVGPDGYSENENFNITKQNQDTRSDTIFSVEFDGPDSLTKTSDGKYQAKIVLFIHDSSRSEKPEEQYFFRKLTVIIDNQKSDKNDYNHVKVLKVTSDINLAQTFFSVYTDISERKLILIDKENSITKVFPVGVGSFDIRTLPGMDNFVGSMTEELKNNAIISKTIPKSPDSNRAIHYQINESRTNPDYYRGRPFIGVLDDNGKKYKEIGFHYQIDNDKLKRGFVSHGCIRVRDKDLYQLSSIVFKGVQNEIPVKVVNSFRTHPDLIEFENIDHPYTKINNEFKRVIYADKEYLSSLNKANVHPSIISIKESKKFTEVERFEWCRQNGKYHTIRYSGPWASVLGTDCLTRTAGFKGDIGPILDYMNGFSNQIPEIYQHKTTNVSNYANASLEETKMCDVGIGRAANYYEKIMKIQLTYKAYIDFCKCDVANKKIRKNDIEGRKVFDQMCNK